VCEQCRQPSGKSAKERGRIGFPVELTESEYDALEAIQSRTGETKRAVVARLVVTEQRRNGAI
jgi:hypothetical protein